MQDHVKILINQFVGNELNKWLQDEGYNCTIKKIPSINKGLILCEYENDDNEAMMYSYSLFTLDSGRLLYEDEVFPESKEDFDFLKNSYSSIKNKIEIVE